MIRRKFLLAGLVMMVVVPVVLMWYTAWPLLRPWYLPEMVTGEMQAPLSRTLTPQEVQGINTWIATHRTGWGTPGEKPPPAGKSARWKIIVVLLRDAQDHMFVFSFWRFRHGNDVVGIQTEQGGRYRMRSLEKKDARSLRNVLEEQADSL